MYVRHYIEPRVYDGILRPCEETLYERLADLLPQDDQNESHDFLQPRGFDDARETTLRHGLLDFSSVDFAVAIS